MRITAKHLRAAGVKVQKPCGRADLLPMPVMMLTLPMPPTVNTYYRHVGHKVLISAKGRAYREAVARIVAERGEQMQPGRYSVVVGVYPPDRRCRDLDNLGKSLLDSLTKSGVYADDGTIDDLRLIRGPVKAGGEVHVTIKVLEQA